MSSLSTPNFQLPTPNPGISSKRIRWELVVGSYRVSALSSPPLVARIGIIAGNGKFPFLALQGARDLGHDVTVVAIKEEAFPDLEEAARKAGAALHWVSLGQLGKCIKLLKAAGVSQAVMAGQVRHVKIFSGIVPDLTLLSVLTRLKARNTDALISAVADVMRDEGIELLDSTVFLAPLLAATGRAERPRARRARSAPTSSSATGWPTPSPRSTSVRPSPSSTRRWSRSKRWKGPTRSSAVPAISPGRGVRIVKVAKPKQDMRFDVPVIGLATIQAMRVAGASALSIDAGRTLVLDGEHVFASANEAGDRHRRPAGRGGACVADPLRIAVIGVGHLGRHHARILSAMDGRDARARSSTRVPERAAEIAAASGRGR